MNAMSNCVLLERHGWYGRRPNVEMPEKMESACSRVSYCREASSLVVDSYLFATITRKRVVPQTLMRAVQRVLVMTMVAVRSYSSREAQKRGSEPHLCGILRYGGVEKEEEEMNEQIWELRKA
jgi:hypothetical protein